MYFIAESRPCHCCVIAMLLPCAWHRPLRSPGPRSCECLSASCPRIHSSLQGASGPLLRPRCMWQSWWWPLLHSGRPVPLLAQGTAKNSMRQSSATEAAQGTAKNSMRQSSATEATPELALLTNIMQTGKADSGLTCPARS